jgi:hypothetical protein
VTADRATTALRRAVLGVTLQDDGVLGDLQVRDAGVVLPGNEGLDELSVPWGELLLASGDPTGADPAAGRRIARWLRLRVLLHAHLSDGSTDGDKAGRAWVLARIRPRALPFDHALSPGASWPRGRVLGGALETGLALRGVDDDGRPDPDAVGLLPAGVLVAARVDLGEACARAERYLQDMATLAADRLRRDPTAVLRPLGDADVLTLLSAREFRVALVDGMGMRSAAIPSRSRGWLDLGRLDPAFALSAALLTDADDRGFPRPVLVTADEVTMARAGGDAVRQSLADPAPREPAQPVSRFA